MPSVTSKDSLKSVISEEVARLIESCVQVVEARLEEVRQNAKQGGSLSSAIPLEPMTGLYGEVKNRVFESLKTTYEDAGWKVTFENTSRGRWVTHWSICLE